MTDYIDTHQHLIYHDRFGYDWAAGIDALSQSNFTAQDYLALTADKPVKGSIFMEVAVNDSDYQAEAEFISTLVGDHGILGQIASCRPETDDGFDDWLSRANDLNIVGYRRVLHVMPDDLSKSDRFRKNLRKIGTAGKTFDLCVLPHQLGIGYDLAKACDNTQFILNHCGVPNIADNEFDVWADGISQIAGLDHMMVKVSGLTAYCGTRAHAFETLSPWFDHVLNCFGPNRMVWGGDWPVVNLGSGLPRWIDLSSELMSGLSSDEQLQISSNNALAAYGLT
ncbi:amidohydrolase family protein [Rhodobacteraceae bacterium]|nr:amidohydrolase family protein [Paracoccaceae bacterium]